MGCDCEKMAQQLETAIGNLASALTPPSRPDDYEGSEPLAVGGPIGSYPVRSPFMGPSQFKVDSISNGNGGPCIVQVSTQRKQASPLFASTDQGVGDYSPIIGLLYYVQPQVFAPVASEWYDVQDSEGYVYVLVASTTAAAYVNLKFRQRN